MNPEIVHALQTLNITPQVFNSYFAAVKSYGHAVEALVKFKAECVKKAYRKACMEHHPDHGGSEETFKKIQAAYEVVKALNVQPPQPERVHIRVFGGWYNVMSGSAASTATSTAYYYYS